MSFVYRTLSVRKAASKRFISGVESIFKTDKLPVGL